MIEKLKIDNFKCFDIIDVELKKINIFCGTNSSGKSSAIQTLLLIDNCMTEENSLNGQWLNLGQFDEVRNFSVRRDKVKIELLQGSSIYSVVLDEDGIQCLNQVKGYKKINYISANRVGPKDFFHKITNSKNFIGENAEYLIDYLYKNLTTSVDDERIFDNKSKTLEHQVNFWLNKILNATINLENITSGNIITANYSLNSNKKVRPYHIGAGISYVIGILILCLVIEKGKTIILENPEIHLHPKAQSELSSFLCFIAKSGVQLIIETHSDHIFNGVRKEVHKNRISKDDVSINFFELDESGLSHNHVVELNDNGRVINVKDNLFDQFDNDLDELLNLR